LVDFFSATQRLTPRGKLDVILLERHHQKSADDRCRGAPMRAIRDDDSKTFKPKKKINDQNQDRQASSQFEADPLVRESGAIDQGGAKSS
jgi:hypothetical protein